MLEGKKILLGVTGSIAAYKSVYLTRLLVKAGAEVKIVMTPAAKSFVGPLTFSTLSRNPVFSDYFKPETGEWNNHVELALWADLLVIAPASANTMAKMATGLCDNLLLAVYLSAKCPVLFAPAMDLDMYKHPATRKNIATLTAYGNIMLPPGNGELASGLEGEGRMAEPEEILEQLKHYFNKSQPGILKGKKVLVTAGPTYEAIDPVRFLGNHSSGKMGFALAEAFADAGASVTLVSGPTHLELTNPHIQRIDITSAAQLLHECLTHFETSDITVMSAAVADFRPAHPEKEKIKKNGSALQLELEPTTDILAELGKRKKKNQLLVGFALETANELENAKLKLNKKNLDLIVLNSLNDKGAGFAADTNKITLLGKNNKIEKFELKQKTAVATDIVNQVISLFNHV